MGRHTSLHQWGGGSAASTSGASTSEVARQHPPVPTRYKHLPHHRSKEQTRAFPNRRGSKTGLGLHSSSQRVWQGPHLDNPPSGFMEAKGFDKLKRTSSAMRHQGTLSSFLNYYSDKIQQRRIEKWFVTARRSSQWRGQSTESHEAR